MTTVLPRAAAALRRGAPARLGIPPAPATDGDVSRDLPDRPTLGDVVAVAPDLRRALLARSREYGVVTGVLAALVLPAWALVDRVLTPGDAALFLAVRLLCDVPILLLTGALAFLPAGRRRPEVLTFAILAVVQIEVAWMIPRSSQPEYYVMGLTLAVYASGCVLLVRPRFTAALVATTWAALAAFVLAARTGVRSDDLVATAGYLGTASLIGLVAHVRRHAGTVAELGTRLRLEHEQQRSRVLLGRLERLSHEDPLTGLANRRRWDAELAAVCAEAREHGGVVSVLLVDLDHFKRVNDAHGHPGGDEVLRQVAGLLVTAVRGEDLVARLGGDELAVLLPGADERRAMALAEQVRGSATTLRPEGFAAGEVTISIGVAVAADAEAYPLELQSRADEQLYRAKITRNAVGGPQPAMSLVPTPRSGADAC